MTKDRIFNEPSTQIVDFVFDEKVATVFPDMIRRSVPCYELVVPMTGLLIARQLASPAPRLVYDLGCSLGATTLAILHALEALGLGRKALDLEIRAVDSSAAMLEQARASTTDPRVTFIEADIRHLQFAPSAAVTLNWVLQFLPAENRSETLQKIHASLEPGGLFVLSEKIRSDDPALEAFNNAAHLDFKRANGYSELEISQKRTALEQVMVPETIDDHLQRLRDTGFQNSRVWFQCLNWASFVASK
jgi:tRNA (cmo5U34)-methyltransferase